MISLRVYIITALVAAVLAVLAYSHGYSTAWKAGRVALAQTYKDKAERQQVKAVQNIQKGETKAAVATDASNKQFEVIERETIKYVNRPATGGVKFDPDRVRIKAAAVEAAGNIPGLDDAPGETTTAGERPRPGPSY